MDNVRQDAKPRKLSELYSIHTTELSNIITEITLIWQQLYKNVPQEKRKHVKNMTNLLAVADRILVDQLPNIQDSIVNQEDHIDKLRREIKSRKPVLYSPGRWRFTLKSWVRQGLSTDSHIVRVINTGEVFDVAQVVEYQGRVRGQVEEGFITLHSMERNIAFVVRDTAQLKLKREEEKVPDVIFVSGRAGFNSAMNGAFQRGSTLHDGYPYFKNKENGWVLRYYRGRWMFDWRGTESDDISAAVLRTDAPHPGNSDQIWKVFDGRRWVKDPNIQCKGMSLPTSPKSEPSKRTPQKSRKRQPSRIGAFFSSFLGSNKREPAVNAKALAQNPGGGCEKGIVAIENAPREVMLSGREGYNAAICGTYTRGGHLHNERVFYQRPNPIGMVWFIRWRPSRSMWLIDLREDGLPSADEGHCQAFSKQDVQHPVLISDTWFIWNEDGFEADPNVKIARANEDRVAEPSFALPQSGFQKRQPASPRKVPVPSINISAKRTPRRHNRTMSSGSARRSSAIVRSHNPLASALQKQPQKNRHHRSFSSNARSMKPSLNRVKSLSALGEEDPLDQEEVTTPSNLVRLEDAELWGGAALEKQEQEMLEELAKLKVAPLAKMKSQEDLLKHAKAIEQHLLDERDHKLAVILAKEEKVKRMRSNYEPSESQDSFIESESVGDLEFDEEDDTLTEDSQMTDMSDPIDDISDGMKKMESPPMEPVVELARQPIAQVEEPAVEAKKRGPGKMSPAKEEPEESAMGSIGDVFDNLHEQPEIKPAPNEAMANKLIE